MNKVFKALKQSFEACLDFRILFLVFVPFMLAMLIAVILFFTAGAWWMTAATGLVEHSWLSEYLSQKWQVMSEGTLASVSYILGLLIAMLVILPFSYLLAILLVSLVLLRYSTSSRSKAHFPSVNSRKISLPIWHDLLMWLELEHGGGANTSFSQGH